MTLPTVRDARIEDVDAIVALVSAYDAEREVDADPGVVRGAILACLDLPEHDLLVAVHVGEIVGYAAVHWIPVPLNHGCEGYVSDLLVHQAWRGRGVGTLLVAALEARAKAAGGARLTVNHWTSDESFVRRFFDKAGFYHRTEVANFVKTIDG